MRDFLLLITPTYLPSPLYKALQIDLYPPCESFSQSFFPRYKDPSE